MFGFFLDEAVSPIPLHVPTNKHTHTQAGQTKFKTAAVEYVRALGLKPTVIASSNHLGKRVDVDGLCV